MEGAPNRQVWNYYVGNYSRWIDGNDLQLKFDENGRLIHARACET